MSWWTYVNGIINVSVPGRTQAEKRYILETVLDHLPFVTGSEKNMNVYIVQKNGYNCSSSHTEFDEWGGYHHWDRLSLETQDEYILVVNGNFRDRMFDQTYREFQKWLCRLAKRLWVDDVMVAVTGYEKSVLIRNANECYTKMGNLSVDEESWWEYLMWDRKDLFE